MKPLELAGKKFGRLAVIRRVNRKSRGNWMWRCSCDHNNPSIDPVFIVTAGTKLVAGQVKSCGCLRRDVSSAHGKTFYRHGMSKTLLYGVWRNMKNRCLDKSRKDYKDYGDRGITVCRAWMKSDNFFAWAKSSGYRNGVTLERKNKNKNYSPANCCWVTMKVQVRNRRSTVVISAFGIRAPLAEHCERVGLRYCTVADRIKRGWTVEEALSSKSDRHLKRHHTVNGVLIKK